MYLACRWQHLFRIYCFLHEKLFHLPENKCSHLTLCLMKHNLAFGAFRKPFFKYNSSFFRGQYFWSEITSHHSMKSATLQLNKFQQAQNRLIVTIEHHYNTLLQDWVWKRQCPLVGFEPATLRSAIRFRKPLTYIFMVGFVHAITTSKPEASSPSPSPSSSSFHL